METLKDRLLKRLTEKDWKPADLARNAFVSRASVSQWLSGDVKTISHHNLERVAKALDVDPSWLISGRDRPMHHVAQDIATYGGREEALRHYFDKLLTDQQDEVLRSLELMVEANKERLQELLEKYASNGVPDEIVAKHLPPAPKD